MDSLLDIEVTVAAWGLIIWVALVILQLADLGASLLDVRGAHDTEGPGRQARSRFREYFWSIPLAAVVILGISLGVDLAGRLFFDVGSPMEGLFFMLALVAIALLSTVAIVAAVTRAEAVSYTSLRANLRAAAGQRIAHELVEELHSQLEEIDAKKRSMRFGLRDAASLVELRSQLDTLSDSFRASPPRGLAAISMISWRTANSYLWRASIQRLVPVLVALGTLCTLLAAVIRLGAGNSWLLVVLVTLAPVFSYAIAVAATRASLAAKAAWHAVNQKQRSDVTQLLADLERSSRKGVVGLGDRVTRALQILREQQGQQ